MKICLACHNEFPVWVEVQGKVRNLQRRQYCLTCSPWGERNTKQIHLSMVKNRVCPRCQLGRKPEEFYSRRGVEGASSYCRSCTNDQTVERHRALKAAAVAYLGGKCSLCGYSKHLSALEFHHLEPEHKDFTISKTRSRSLDTIKPELEKCRLLCANCHREVHHGATQL